MKTLRTASLSGANSNEFYSLHFPESILRFCGFDFSNFIRKCTEFYKHCVQNGEYYYDEAVALRNSISACHKYYEINVHGIFDKVVPDFMIENMCREKGIGTSALWNSLISPKNNFEREIFKRLTEYRHNKATNQWVNLLKIQEYAKRKVDFIFSEDVDVAIALAKRDYFDLTFSIAANEMGYGESTFTGTKLYSVGRLPSAPFIIGKVAKEIESTTLSQVQFPDEVREKPSDVRCDTDAMDVFSAIKNYIPSRTDSVFNTVINTMRSMPKKVYIAESFKAVIDLEIDLILESKAVLRSCKRCGSYFLYDDEYNYDYCDNPSNGGKSCLELYEESAPGRSPEEVQELEKSVNELYSYMSKRINVDLTQREFAEWYQHFMAIKGNIAEHKVTIEEFADFEKYSKELKFDRSSSQQQPANTQADEEAAKTQVKPFVFERVDRSEVYEQESRLRRKREREIESGEEAEEITPSIEDIAQEDIKPTVKVMKASDAQASEVTLFENPFDGAFDEQIDRAEKDVKSRDFKPLDDIFNFGDDDLSSESIDISETDDPNGSRDTEKREDVSADPVKETVPAEDKTAAPADAVIEEKKETAETPQSFGGTSAIEALRQRYASGAKSTGSAENKTPFAHDGVSDNGGFDKAFSKASYMRENSPATKNSYVAGRYMKTVNETNVTDQADDVDILPESAAAVKSVKEPPVIKLDIPTEDNTANEPKTPQIPENSAIAKLRAAAAASAKEQEQAKTPVSGGILQKIRGQSAAKASGRAEPGRSKDDMHDPKYTTNKTRRVLDGIMNPVKNKNPFIDE